MEDFRGIILTILGVIIFITFLPALLWLFLILGAILLVIIIYSRYKYNKFMNNTNSEDYYESSTTNKTIDDVIDVEYSEREDKDD